METNFQRKLLPGSIIERPWSLIPQTLCITNNFLEVCKVTVSYFSRIGSPSTAYFFRLTQQQSTSDGSSGLCLPVLQSCSWHAVLITPLKQHLRHEADAATSVTTSAWNNIRWLLTAYSNCRLKSRLFAWSCLSSSAKKRKHINHAWG